MDLNASVHDSFYSFLSLKILVEHEILSLHFKTTLIERENNSLVIRGYSSGFFDFIAHPVLGSDFGFDFDFGFGTENVGRSEEAEDSSRSRFPGHSSSFGMGYPGLGSFLQHVDSRTPCSSGLGF